MRVCMLKSMTSLGGRAYTGALCVVCVTVMLITHWLCTPIVRPGNANLKNPYGEQGAQRLPHAIIIGARKAGTRAILSYLKRHPDIAIAQSEVHFFDFWRNYRQGLEFYRSLMPYSRANQLTVEKTPAYFHSTGVPERIHGMNSSVKLILVVRDPVERAVSDYVQHHEKYAYFRALGYSFEDVAKSGSMFHGFIDRSNYMTLLQDWLRFFPKQQLLVLDGKKLAQDPINEMHRTETFLGVRHYLNQQLFVYDTKKNFYCIKDKPNQKEPHCLGKSKGRPHPEIDPQVRAQLVEYFRPFNMQLFELIGREFDWAS